MTPLHRGCREEVRAVNGFAKMTLGSWEYYFREVRSVDGYYLADGEEPGRWIGSGSAALELAGEPEAVMLRRLFDEGCHPATGDALGRPFLHVQGRATVTGYALSFSPPKSVSLLWALGGDEVREQVRIAHDESVAAAIGLLEDHAAFSRVGKGGFSQVDTAGFVATAFFHRTSRARDPQLHTHVLIANKVRCADGEWRSLDGRELYAMQKPAGMLYNAALRSALSERLGVEFEPVDRNGQADVVGVPKTLIGRFSARRRQVLAQGDASIAAAELKIGRELSPGERAERYQRAALSGRPAKTDREPERELWRRWRAEAVNAGYPPAEWLQEVIARERVPVLRLGGIDPAVIDDAVRALTETHSTFGRAQIMKVLLPLVPHRDVAGPDGTRAWLEDAARAAAEHPQVIALGCPVLAEVPTSLRRRDGLPLAERHNGVRYTTLVTLQREATVIELAKAGRTRRIGLAEQRDVEAAVVRFGLSSDQAAALGRLCRAGEQVVCLVGPAGTGKTRTVSAAAQAWDASGVRVRGVAVSAVAAGVLGGEANIPTDTLARTLSQLRQSRNPLSGGEVVVVDEAGMVATDQLAELLTAIEDADAKAVLVGDDRQLPPVGAGGLFRLLVTETDAVVLGEVRRFVHDWERAASLRLRAGDASVVDVYDNYGRIRGGDHHDMVETAFTAWLAARAAGESVVMLGTTHAVVDTLAVRARATLVALGAVEADGICARDQIIGVGDEIVTCRNDRTLRTTTGHWVRNGDRWAITATNDDGTLAVTSLDGRGDTVLPATYAAEQVRLAYALTVHKAQGLTVNRSILVADDGLTAELTYVAMTRGRLTNHAYVMLDTDQAEHRITTPPTARDVLAAAVRRPGVEPAATRVLSDELARSEDLAVLHPLWEQARDHILEHAGPDRSEELAQLRALALDLPVLEAAHKALTHELGLIERDLLDAQETIDAARPVVLASHERRWWRQPRRRLVDAAKTQLGDAQERHSALELRHRDGKQALGRADRDLQVARRAVAELPEVQGAQANREQWLARHPDELAWEKGLRQAIRHRTAELAANALAHLPAHVRTLIGRPGQYLDHDAWAEAAGRIEAYRERWRIQPEHVGRPTFGSPAQAQHWRALQRSLPEQSVPRRSSRLSLSGLDLR